MKRLRVGDHQYHGTAGPSFQHYREPQAQEAGQDTMSEGWASPPRPAVATTPLTAPARSTDGCGGGGDVDYQNVNHILGALHLERKRRTSVLDSAQKSTSSSTMQEEETDSTPFKQQPRNLL